jgi:2',3'-cyclic-nucleotide 2'-phosphodiesterase/3'-nucleotidase
MKAFKIGITAFIFAGALFAKEVDVTILGTSDVHGRIIPWDYSTDTADFSGGYSQIATLVEKLRSENKNLILTDIGDAIQDNGIERFNDMYMEAGSHPVVEILNHMKYDFFVPGNHEFNFGMDFLDSMLKNFEGKILASNIIDSNGNRYYLPSAIIEKDGVKIGFIGATTPLIEQFEAGTDNLRDLKFTAPVKEIQKEADKLKADGADAVILLAHMGLPNENNIEETGVEDIANKISGIDAIIAGHYHKNVAKKVINGIVVTEPYKYGQNISKIDLKFDVENDNVKLISVDSDSISVKNTKADKDIEKIYSKYHEELRKDANIKLGRTMYDLVQENKIKGIPTIYTEDTGLATLFGEVGFYFCKDADVIALSIDQEHAKLDKGIIKKKNINYNYRYTGGEITLYEVKGQDLKDYLEWSAAYYNTIKDGDLLLSFNKKRRSEKYATFDFAKGVLYDIDLREESGNRIKNLRFADGREITKNMPIKLGMNSYRMERMLSKGEPLEGRKHIKPIWDSKVVYGEEDGTIRYMTAKYISEVKHGVLGIKASNNWKLVGLPKGADVDKAIELVNSGKLELHNAGRATNVESITIDDLKNMK